MVQIYPSKLRNQNSGIAKSLTNFVLPLYTFPASFGDFPTIYRCSDFFLVLTMNKWNGFFAEGGGLMSKVMYWNHFKSFFPCIVVGGTDMFSHFTNKRWWCFVFFFRALSNLAFGCVTKNLNSQKSFAGWRLSEWTFCALTKFTITH